MGHSPAPTAVILLLIFPALAGCLAGTDDVPAALGPAEAAAEPPELPGLDATFQVLSRAGGLTRVAAKAWLPDGATTVILGVHGCCGSSAHGTWDVLETPGYSLAAREASVGRAFVAIDLPGTGRSPGGSPLAGAGDDEVLIVHQIARALRHGAYEIEGAEKKPFHDVVAAGHSRGGGIVMTAEARFGSFDAVLMTGSSLGGIRDEAAECFRSGPCGRYEFEPHMPFFLDNADPRVIEEVTAPFGKVARPAVAPDAFGTHPDPWSTVRVPVLFLHGAEDWFYERESMEKDPDRVPNAARADLVMIERTGHFPFHHHSKDEAFAALDLWMDEVGL